MDRQKLLRLVIESLNQERKISEENLESARQTIINAPGAMQSHSDTTKSQMSCLAAEMERSMSEKNRAIGTLQNMLFSGSFSDTGLVKLGSIVEVLIERDERETYFILPVAGGVEILDNDKTITVITAEAPLAMALIGKRQGQTSKLQVGSRQRTLTIVSVQ